MLSDRYHTLLAVTGDRGRPLAGSAFDVTDFGSFRRNRSNVHLIFSSYHLEFFHQYSAKKNLLNSHKFLIKSLSLKRSIFK